MWGPLYFKALKIEPRNLSRNSKVITFHLDLRFRCIIYRDARNWTRKLSTNSNDHNFWLEHICEAHDISTCSKMNNGGSREIQMVITFHSDLRFWCIIYRDAWNSTWSSRQIQIAITFDSFLCVRPMIYRDVRKWIIEALEKFKCHNISLYLRFRHIIYQDAWNSTWSSPKIQTSLIFYLGVCLWPTIVQDAWKWTMEALKKFE